MLNIFYINVSCFRKSMENNKSIMAKFVICYESQEMTIFPKKKKYKIPCDSDKLDLSYG